MKKLLFLLLLTVLVIVIYILNIDKKVFYLALGDEISSDNIILNITKFYQEKNIHEKTIKYTKNNYRTVDLINDIKDNIKLNGQVSINNALIKADIITISIGFNDFINYIDDYAILKDNLLNLKEDMNVLLKILRERTKEKLILIGIYNPNYSDKRIDKVIEALNDMYSELANEYNIKYIDIYDELKSDMYIKNKRLSNIGYEALKEKLIKYLQGVII